MEAAHADFNAADHLVNLTSLSDECFAQAYNMPNVGLEYDRKVMQCHVE